MSAYASDETVKTFHTPDALGGMEVRVTGTATSPHFITMDVARALGSTNASTTTKSLDPSEKGFDVVNTPGGPQRVGYVTEAGLYRILMRSNSPNARGFQDWIAREVLPSIRKHGGYIVGQEKLKDGTMTDAEFMARALKIAENIIKATVGLSSVKRTRVISPTCGASLAVSSA